ncbi:MAG TPA: hypothetical protein VIF62_08955, partial [Labilithrix sp.]
MRAVRLCAFVVVLAACGSHDDAASGVGSPADAPEATPPSASRLPVDPHSAIARDDGEFPIILALPPPLGVAAPNGVEGPAAVAEAGITYFKTGATTWTSTTLATEKAWQAKAASLGVKTWVNLGDLTGAQS